MARPGAEEAGQLAGEPGSLGMREVPAVLSLSAPCHAVWLQWGPSPCRALRQTGEVAPKGLILVLWILETRKGQNE